MPRVRSRVRNRSPRSWYPTRGPQISPRRSRTARPERQDRRSRRHSRSQSSSARRLGQPSPVPSWDRESRGGSPPSRWRRGDPRDLRSPDCQRGSSRASSESPTWRSPKRGNRRLSRSESTRDVVNHVLKDLLVQVIHWSHASAAQIMEPFEKPGIVRKETPLLAMHGVPVSIFGHPNGFQKMVLTFAGRIGAVTGHSDDTCHELAKSMVEMWQQCQETHQSLETRYRLHRPFLIDLNHNHAVPWTKLLPPMMDLRRNWHTILTNWVRPSAGFTFSELVDLTMFYFNHVAHYDDPSTSNALTNMETSIM
eukprot:maker-scaffold425_size175135-snap-gene-0.37 protein:Tk05820 transcript:maker-scaffold425_size175135-snap-gene-0.37-mRNA-1 annotation:"---NA---"